MTIKTKSCCYDDCNGYKKNEANKCALHSNINNCRRYRYLIESSSSSPSSISRQHTDRFKKWLDKYFRYDPVVYEYKTRHDGERCRLSSLYKRYERAYKESPMSD